MTEKQQDLPQPQDWGQIETQDGDDADGSRAEAQSMLNAAWEDYMLLKLENAELRERVD